MTDCSIKNEYRSKKKVIYVRWHYYYNDNTNTTKHNHKLRAKCLFFLSVFFGSKKILGETAVFEPRITQLHEHYPSNPRYPLIFFNIYSAIQYNQIYYHQKKFSFRLKNLSLQCHRSHFLDYYYDVILSYLTVIFLTTIVWTSAIPFIVSGKPAPPSTIFASIHTWTFLEFWALPQII